MYHCRSYRTVQLSISTLNKAKPKLQPSTSRSWSHGQRTNTLTTTDLINQVQDLPTVSFRNATMILLAKCLVVILRSTEYGIFSKGQVRDSLARVRRGERDSYQECKY